jgi:hypothetical protein
LTEAQFDREPTDEVFDHDGGQQGQSEVHQHQMPRRHPERADQRQHCHPAIDEPVFT